MLPYSKYFSRYSSDVLAYSSKAVVSHILHALKFMRNSSMYYTVLPANPTCSSLEMNVELRRTNCNTGLIRKVKKGFNLKLCAIDSETVL